MIIHTCANLRTVIMTILLILLEYFIIQKNIYIGLEVTVYHLQVSHIVAIIVLTNCKKKNDITMLSRKLLPKNVTNVIKGFACQCRNYSQNEVKIQFRCIPDLTGLLKLCRTKLQKAKYCALYLVKLLLLCIRRVNYCKSYNARLPNLLIFNACNFYSCEYIHLLFYLFMKFYMCNGMEK